MLVLWERTSGGFHKELRLVLSRATRPNLGLAIRFSYLLLFVKSAPAILN